MENLSVDELIVLTAKGDMRALEKLYNDMSRPVYMLALSITGSPDSAQDIVQDTFVRVYKYASRFKSSGSGKAWIAKIARNLSYDCVFRDGRTQPLEEDVKVKNTPEDDAVASALFAAAFEVLSESEREVVMLHASGAMTVSQIASVLSCPVGTVKWRHAQALKKLRGYLDEGGEAN